MMIESIILGLDLTHHTHNTYQYYTAVFVVALVLFMYVAIKWRTPYAGLDFDEQRVKSTFEGGMKDAEWRSTYIHADDSPDDRRAYIESVMSEEYTEPDSIRDAIHETRRTLAETSSDTPFEVLRYGGVGILYLVFGTLAVGSLAMLPSFPSLDTSFTEFVSPIASIGSSTLGFFPHAEVWFGIALLIGVLVGELLFNQYIVVGLLLLVIGFALSIIRDQYGTVTVPDSARPARLRTATTVIGSIGLITVFGIASNAVLYGLSQLLTRLGVEAFTPGRAELLSAVLVGLLFVVLVVYGMYIVYNRLKLAYTELHASARDASDEKRPSHLALRAGFAYYVGSALAKVLSVIALVMIPIFVGYTLVSGRLVTIIGLITSASLLHVAFAVSAVVLVGFVAALMFQDAAQVASKTFGRAMTMKAVRTRFYLTVAPFIIIFLSLALAWAFQLPLWSGMLVGLILVIVYRTLKSFIQKLKYRMVPSQQTDVIPASRVLVETTTIDLGAYGGEVYVGRLDGNHSVVATSRNQLSDRLETDVEWKLEDCVIPLSVESQMFIDARRLGQIDYDESLDRLFNQTHHIIVGTLIRHDGFTTESHLFENASDHVPEWMVEEELSNLRQSGIVDKNGDTYILLKEYR